MIKNPSKTNLKQETTPDPKSQYRYLKQKRIPVFPQRLYDMLENSEEQGYDDIISWMPDGKSFKIHISGSRCSASEQAIIEVLKKNNFQQTKFRSFLRQLNQYGFERTHRGKGEFRHEFFVRGKPELLEGKSIDNWQQPHQYYLQETKESDDFKQTHKSYYQLLRMSPNDKTSLFLDSDQSNYWNPSSANRPLNNSVCQETAWQMYAKSLVSQKIEPQALQHQVQPFEQQSSLFALPSALTGTFDDFHKRSVTPPTNELNDDDTIPTIDSGDEYLADFMTSQFDRTNDLLQEEMGNRYICQVHF